MKTLTNIFKLVLPLLLINFILFSCSTVAEDEDDNYQSEELEGEIKAITEEKAADAESNTESSLVEENIIPADPVETDEMGDAEAILSQLDEIDTAQEKALPETEAQTIAAANQSQELLKEASENAEAEAMPAEVDLAQETETAKVITETDSTPEMTSNIETNVEETNLYVVEPGDTLASISYKFYGTTKKWKKLAKQNGLENPYVLIPGDEIKYENNSSTAKFDDITTSVEFKTIEVKQGDTLGSIAKEAFGKYSWWKVLWKQNISKIPNPDQIKPGQILRYRSPQEQHQALHKAGRLHKKGSMQANTH
ncbi:MAG: hypothetical protein CMP10_01160 [Zetaproteobacteria bacterium]|nr:hypothetical protein [Pseudobdellovibrionaceae bacterium]